MNPDRIGTPERSVHTCVVFDKKEFLRELRYELGSVRWSDDQVEDLAHASFDAALLAAKNSSLSLESLLATVVVSVTEACTSERAYELAYADGRRDLISEQEEHRADSGATPTSGDDN